VNSSVNRRKGRGLQRHGGEGLETFTGLGGGRGREGRVSIKRGDIVKVVWM
jgi:hypothetical protein